MSTPLVTINDEKGQVQYVPVKTGLRHSLSNLERPTLRALRQALENEKYICVGNWANCSIDENKPVGCLFSAAWMYTKDFSNKLNARNGDVRAVFHRLEWDDDQLNTISDALDDSNDNIAAVIGHFDTWGMQKSKHRRLEYSWTNEYGLSEARSEDVLTNSARTELIAMITVILESR